MNLRSLLPLLLLLFAASIPAQEQTFRDSVEVRVINLDVFVEDGKGNRVTGLSADDFEILENGKPQPITNFAEYRAGEFVEPAPDPAAPLPSVRPVAERQPRTVVFVVDAFHQTPQIREKLFNRIRSFLRESLDTGDRAALFNWRRSLSNVVPLTTDLHEIDLALSKLGGLVLPPEESGLDQIQQFLEEAEAFRAESDGISTSGPSSLQAQMETTIRNCAEEYLSEMETKTIALESLISTLGGIEGRKLLVYVAGRFPADTGVYCQSIMRTPEMGPAALTFAAGSYNTDDLVDSVTDAANAAGVTFYPIRPNTIERRTTAVEYVQESTVGASTELGQSLVMMNDADALATLAEQTGGRLAVGDWMVDDLLPEIVSDLNDYYSLGYRATSDGRDRERRLTVRTKDRSLRVRTREAFVEKSRLTEVRDQLIANLVAEPLRGDIELDVVLGDLRVEKRNRSILPIEVRIPLDQLLYNGSKPTADVRLLSAAGSTPGEVTEIGETKKRIEEPPADLSSPFITWKVDLAVPPGGTKVAFAVLDETSGLVGYATVDRTAEGLARAAEEELANLGRWDHTLLKHHLRGRPLLVYFRPENCFERQGFRKIPICDEFETGVLAHPEIAQRLRGFELIRWTPDGRTADWPERRPGLMLARLDGTPVVTWPELPDGTNLARVLDTLGSHAAEIVRVNELVRVERIEEAEMATAMLQIRFGLRREAGAVLERLASKSTTPKVSELASVRLAFLESTRDRDRSLARLRALTSDTTDPSATAEAWLAIASLSPGDGELEALQQAFAVAPEGSSQKAIAAAGIERLSAPAPQSSIIRIAPVAIASGRTELRTIVQSSRVDSVEFFLDGKSIQRDGSAPFRAITDLERLPTRHELRVVARDENGEVIGEHTTTLNGRSDAFWVRFVSPAGDVASGEATVELAIQSPSEAKIDRVELSTGGDPIAVDGPPWRTTVTIDPDQITILEATAFLDNGQTSEDTMILNAPGLAETAGVHLVELPLIPIGEPDLAVDDIRIRESGQPRKIEALLGADTIPITVGFVIDSSASMAGRILDVQSAAAGLIERVLRPNDRGFLVSFDSEARLEVGVTGDRSRLVIQLRSLRPAGSTALYDALMLSLLQFEPLGGRRALVVFSDGDDRASRYKLEDVAEVAKRAAVPIYLVRANVEGEQRLAPRSGNIPQLRSQSSNVVLNRQQQMRLDHLTRESGGGFFELRSLDELDQVFSEIGRMMTRQMLVTYLTDTSRNEEWRPVEVRLDGTGTIRAPQGYYARPH